jgi:SNF family Na+-dependent transporter
MGNDSTANDISGPGIAFMVYPDALATLPLPQLWSVLFFLMLAMIGVNSAVIVFTVYTNHSQHEKK